MAKVTPFPLAPDAYPRVRGVFITRWWRGIMIAQKWPRKRGKPTNPKVIFTSQQFALASKMAANAEPMSYDTAVYSTKGTSLLPRDFLVMAAFGKAYEVIGPNGEVYYQNSHAPPED